MQRSELSEHDKAVLNSIFNPLLPIGEASFYGDEFFTDENEDGGEKRKYESEVLSEELKQIQKHAIYESEKKNYQEALKLFAEALHVFPNSVILLNDRAQCFRLAGLDEAAMKDLNLALEIANKTENSKIKTRVLCQRGMLHRKSGDLDKARTDFTEASKMGSKFARKQLVEINPYAAMCNQMLREMTSKLSDPGN